MLSTVLLSAGIAAGCILAGKILYHYFQLESYQFPGYFRTIRRNPVKSLMPGICVAVALTAVIFLTRSMVSQEWILCMITLAAMIVCGYITGKIFSEKKAKKPFVFTARMKRLYAVSFALMVLVLFFVANVSGNNQSESHIFLCVFPALLPLWIALCGILAWPVEKIISEMYFRDAQRILLKRKDVIRIGITGSWGKTSVKFILGTILSERFNTLITPASYNTPMGVTKVIRSKLEPCHRVFVAEMGARHVGDIKEMCRLVHPQIGILTSVGPQHLDTFRTVERVAKTKYELIEALPKDGQAFFADDEGICRQLYEKTSISRHITGMDPNMDEIWAEDIRFSPEGSSFILCSHKERIVCKTELLGELNIRNILLCADVALSLGMNMSQIGRGISRIRPVEHRLQLIRHPGGFNVIDDAFNSNIRGAKQAFQVLKQFSHKRIIVTPGMVELGDQEYEMNHEFGSSMADCCDVAVLVGRKRSGAIAAGLEDAGFPAEKICIVNSLEDATEMLKDIAAPGDTVLFENDLPDNYTEG